MTRRNLGWLVAGIIGLGWLGVCLRKALHFLWSTGWPASGRGAWSSRTPPPGCAWPMLHQTKVATSLRGGGRMTVGFRIHHFLQILFSSVKIRLHQSCKMTKKMLWLWWKMYNTYSPRIVFLFIYFSWVEIRLHTEFQLPVLLRSAVVGLNPIQAG